MSPRIAVVGFLLTAAVSHIDAREIDRPFVEELRVEPAGGVLRISGHNLAPVRLLLNGHLEELAVLSASDREIRAWLPHGTGYGRYSVRLIHAVSSEQSEEWSFETGPIGPALDDKR